MNNAAAFTPVILKLGAGRLLGIQNIHWDPYLPPTPGHHDPRATPSSPWSCANQMISTIINQT